MAEKRWAGRTGVRAAGALLLLTLLLQGCGGEAGSQAGKGGAAGGASMQEVADGVFDRMFVKAVELGVRAEDVRGSAEETRRAAERFGGEVRAPEFTRGRARLRPTSCSSYRQGSSKRRSTSCAA